VYAVETVYDDEQPSRKPPPQSIASPFQTLYLLPNAPPEVVKASYKALAKIHHPDARGNSEKMIAINRAFEIITQNK
jgi:DnaJ-class molecular chaperone